MARIMAIDYGTKRTGLAITDSLNIIATALGAVPSKDVLSFIRKYCENQDVETIVVGEPRNMDNSASDVAKNINDFVSKLKKEFPQKKIERFDERFTSKIATQAILMSGAKKKDRQNKSLVDQGSATLILQSYLESKSFSR